MKRMPPDGSDNYNQLDNVYTSLNHAALTSPETELNFLADFLGTTERWIDVELPKRHAAAEKLSQAMEARGDNNYWAGLREQIARDEAGVVGLEFPRILYGSVIISAHTLMERGLCRLLSLYRVLCDKPAEQARGLCKIAKQLDDLWSKGWPRLRETAEWQRMRQWTEVRNALAHASGYVPEEDTVARLKKDLGVEFQKADMGLNGEWEIQLTADNCLAMFNDIMRVFNWLQMREDKHKARRSGERQ